MDDSAYERYGALRVVRKNGQILIRSRYTLGALHAMWCGIGILIVGAYYVVKSTFSGRLGEGRVASWAGWAVVCSIFALLSGIPFFYRKDELVIIGDQWILSTSVFFRKTRRNSFVRPEVIGLLIDRKGELYGLRLETMTGTTLFYSDADLSIVRGAAEFLKPILELPVRDSLLIQPSGNLPEATPPAPKA